MASMTQHHISGIDDETAIPALCPYYDWAEPVSSSFIRSQNA